MVARRGSARGRPRRVAPWHRRNLACRSCSPAVGLSPLAVSPGPSCTRRLCRPASWDRSPSGSGPTAVAGEVSCWRTRRVSARSSLRSSSRSQSRTSSPDRPAGFAYTWRNLTCEIVIYSVFFLKVWFQVVRRTAGCTSADHRDARRFLRVHFVSPQSTGFGLIDEDVRTFLNSFLDVRGVFRQCREDLVLGWHLAVFGVHELDQLAEVLQLVERLRAACSLANGLHRSATSTATTGAHHNADAAGVADL